MSMIEGSTQFRRRQSDRVVYLDRDFHPGVFTSFYLQHVLPVGLLPAATLLYAWQMRANDALRSLSFGQAACLALLLVMLELAAFPAMVSGLQARAAQQRGGVKHDMLLTAVAPCLLLISPIFLFVPSLVASGVALSAVAAGLLLLLGTQAALLPAGRDRERALAWNTVSVAMLSWVVIVVLSLTAWGGIAH